MGVRGAAGARGGEDAAGDGAGGDEHGLGGGGVRGADVDEAHCWGGVGGWRCWRGEWFGGWNGGRGFLGVGVGWCGLRG